MSKRDRRAVLTAGLGILASGAGILACTAADQQPPATISRKEFEELYTRLQPDADEAWRSLPWHTSVLEARALAGREKKPVYMLVRSGHPLGCV